MVPDTITEVTSCEEDTMDKACGYAAVTDERGVIRQSKAIDCPI
jgi:hypothetical protein